MTIFRDQRTISPAYDPSFLVPILQRYGIAPDSLPASDGARPVTLDLSLAMPLAEIWAAAPGDRHPNFLRLAQRVSVALQEALRLWLPYLHFEDPARYEEVEDAACVLTYAACRPFTPQNRQVYSFDVLDSDTPRAVLYSVKRGLPPILNRIETALVAARPGAAKPYALWRMDKLLAFYERKHHPVHSILVAERDLIELFLKRKSAIAGEKSEAAWQVLLDRRMRKFLFKKDFRFLMPLLEVEAARAAAEVAGIDCGFRASLSANFAPVATLNQHEDTPAVGPVGFDSISMCA